MLNTLEKYKHSRYFTEKLWISEKGGGQPPPPPFCPLIYKICTDLSKIHRSMTNLKIRFCVDFGELNHFYTHRINSVTLIVTRKSDDTSNQYIVCGLLDSVAKIPKIPISENSGAPNAFWGDKTDSVADRSVAFYISGKNQPYHY